MAAADLLHALLAGSGAPCVLKVQSLFVLDENSYPLQQDFSLLDFYLNDLKHASHALLWDQRKKMQALQEQWDGLSLEMNDRAFARGLK